MNAYFSLNAWDDDDPERMLTVGKVSLAPELLQVPGTALHRAVVSEVRGLLRDLEPYLVQAAYRVIAKAEKAQRFEDEATA